MLSKTRFAVEKTTLKQISKASKSTTNTTTVAATAALTLSTTATLTKKPSTKKASKRTTTSTTKTITTTPKTITSVAVTTASNSRVINYQRCCWHFLLCCYCCLFICIVQQHGTQAEISSVADISGVLGSVRGGRVGGHAGAALNGGGRISALLNNFDGAQCSSRKFNNMAKTIDDVEDLELDVPVNIAFDNRQRKR